tara:strand:- start:567 stop:764 length:198 start_codon:yes stop_codon:yes gene_type:complete
MLSLAITEYEASRKPARAQMLIRSISYISVLKKNFVKEIVDFWFKLKDVFCKKETYFLFHATEDT